MWLRLVSGLSLALTLLAASHAVVTARSGEPVFWNMMNLLSLLAFALLLPIPLLGWVIGSVGVVFFGGASIWLALLVARPGPAIQADACGIEDRSSLIAVGRVSWTESRRIRQTTTFGQTVIALTPLDWAAVVARQAGWRRPLLAFTRTLTGSDDLLVKSTVLPCRAHELAKALEAMRRDNSPARGSG